MKTVALDNYIYICNIFYIYLFNIFSILMISFKDIYNISIFSYEPLIYYTIYLLIINCLQGS